MGKNFAITPTTVANSANQIISVSEALEQAAGEIEEVISELDSVFDKVKTSLSYIARQIRTQSKKTNKMGEALQKIVQLCVETEQDIIANIASGVVAGITAGAAAIAALSQDPRGKRIGSVDEGFLVVTDENGDIFYGGAQGWFEAEYPEFASYGCGVIAAVNEILYLSGCRDISKADYMDIVRKYFDSGVLRDYAIVNGFPKLGNGAVPPQLENFIMDELKERGYKVDAHWDYTHGYEADLDYIEQSLRQGKPVIWSIHDYDSSDGVTLYEYYDGGIQEVDYKVNDHYVTITAIYEQPDGERMLEVSSWGKTYYVKWDNFIDTIHVDLPTDMTDKEAWADYVMKQVENGVGSSVMIID